MSTSYSALTVPDGEVTSASRVGGRSDLWQIIVRPDSDADVTVTLPATQDCTANGAVCTADGKKLSGGVALTIPGPEPSAGPLTGFTLVDASDQTELATLTDGVAVTLDDPADGDYAIRANVEDGSAVGSVYLQLTGERSVSRTEGIAPYSLYGDGGENALSGGTLPVGSYALQATAYSQGNQSGDELGTLAVSFTVTTPAPVPPTLSAWAVAGGSGIVLSWNRPAENADAVTGYEIQRSIGACGMTTLVADTANQRVSYLDEEATAPGETYAYQVRTIMGDEKSPASNRVPVQLAEATSTPEQDATSPVPPTLCGWKAHNNTDIILSWNRPAQNADAVTGYEILRAVGSGEIVTLVADTQSKTIAYIDETTEAGKAYAYQVKTIMGEEKSLASNRIEVQLPHNPVDLAPSNLAAVTVDGGVGLTWDAPAAVVDSVTGYEILRAVGYEEMATLLANTASTALAYTDQTATEPGETYVYQVSAIRGEEKSQASNRAEVQVPHDPVDLAPSNLDAVTIDGGVGLSWNAPEADDESVTGYHVVRAASPEVVLVEDTGSTVTLFIDTTVKDSGTSYTYRVSALRGNSKSDFSKSDTIVFVDNDPTPSDRQLAAGPFLVKNTNQSVDFQDNLDGSIPKRAQAFETGPHSRGYRLSAIGLSLGAILNAHHGGSSLTATLNAASGSNPGAVICTLNNPASFAANRVNTFGAPSACPTLDRNTTYFFVIGTSGFPRAEPEVTETDSDYEDLGGAEGWTIASNSRVETGGSWFSSSTMLIEVRGPKFVGHGKVQVKNTGQTIKVGFDETLSSKFPKRAQAFTTGSNDAGYTLTSLRARFQVVGNYAHAEDDLTVTLNADSDPGNIKSSPGAVLCTLHNPAYIQKASVNGFRASAGCPTLAQDTTYFFTIEQANDNSTEIEMASTAADDEDSGASPGWSIRNTSTYTNQAGNWFTEIGVAYMIEVWAEANFPPSRSRWSEKLSPSCPPVFGSCGYLGNEGGTLTNNNPLAPAGLKSRYKVERLTWRLDGNSGYVKLIMTALNTDGNGNVTSGSNSSKNREAAIAGKFLEFDYLRLAITNTGGTTLAFSTSNSAPTRPWPALFMDRNWDATAPRTTM